MVLEGQARAAAAPPRRPGGTGPDGARPGPGGTRPAPDGAAPGPDDVAAAAAAAGAAAGAAGIVEGPVRVVSAPGSGDDTIARLAAAEPGRRLVITADRELRGRCETAGARVTGPRWLTERLDAAAR